MSGILNCYIDISNQVCLKFKLFGKYKINGLPTTLANSLYRQNKMKQK